MFALGQVDKKFIIVPEKSIVPFTNIKWSIPYYDQYTSILLQISQTKARVQNCLFTNIKWSIPYYDQYTSILLQISQTKARVQNCLFTNIKWSIPYYDQYTSILLQISQTRARVCELSIRDCQNACVVHY